MSEAGKRSGVESNSRHTIAIAVRPALWGEVLHRLLEQEPDLAVVGRVETEDALVKLMDGEHPDLVVFDYESLGPSAEGVIVRMRRSFPLIRVLVVSSRSNEKSMLAVLRAGAAGMVGKQAEYTTLLAAIRAIAGGETWANRRVMAKALDQLSSLGSKTQGDNPHLTQREHEVVDAVGQGLRNSEIARTLGISEKTVKTHLNNIFTKLGVHSRIELALWAVDNVHRKS